ncbi:polysaccharide biosynthesis family protein [Mycobacterium kansasii]|uniref:Polysaccharide biosynthesis family protein n=1 Tax=Mycobacterium kansasii TaxID=1768 RepID=A0A1V3WV67_MYCKA|nr:polysaccharide biosynthesis family protein [Mycobacterium kansasii]
MAGTTKLVIGASGFLGSHVTRQLVAAGQDVRVMVRRTSVTKGIDDLLQTRKVERCYGDIFDDAALREAMAGCDVVYYCVVDARMWLRDPTPLFRTNVEGLRHVLDAALDAQLRKFVFTSSTGTLAINDQRPVTEDDPHNWNDGGAYIESRVAGENLVMQYVREKGLPAVAMCISTTYGPGDWARPLMVRSSRASPPGGSRFISASPPRWSVSKTPPAPCFWRPTGAASASATSFPIVT